MSIESILERIAAANEKSADALLKMANYAETANMVANDTEEKDKPASKAPAKGRPTKTTAAEKAAATTAETVKEEPKGTTPAPDFLDEGKKVTHEDLKAELQKYVAANNADQQGTARAKELLKLASGVSKIAEVQADKLAAVLAKVKELAGKVEKNEEL